MNKTRFFVALFAFAAACTTQQTGDTAERASNQPTQKLTNMEQLPVIFYNVENLFDTVDDPRNSGDDDFTPDGALFWDQERYREKLSRLEQVFFMPDTSGFLFAGLAEIENRKVLEDLLATGRFANKKYRFVHYDSDDNRGIDCALLYNADLFRTITETKYRVVLEDQPHFRTRDILYIHGMLEETTPLHIFVNHWSSRREGQMETEERRIAAASELRLRIDAILKHDPMANIIVMGDFNDTPTDKSLHRVLRAKGQHELTSGDLVNLLIEEQKQEKGTIVHRGNWDVFDQLIISQGLLRGTSGWAVKDNNAFILKHDELLYTYDNGDQKPNATFGGTNYYGGFSDHLPVYLQLKKTKH